MNTPLQLVNIQKHFKDGDNEIEILKDLNLSVEKGEFVAVVGPSGSGKSTVLSIAGALQSADGGEVVINGRDINQYSDKDKSDVRLKSIGYIFQAANLVPFLNVYDQLKLVTELAGDWNDETKKRADDLLESVGLANKAKKTVQHLSGGEKQRVAIARAFMNDPDIILADEPTAALDANRSKEIVELIAKEVHDKNKAAIMVTHDESVLHYCDKIYEVHDKKLRLRK
ncbi:MAG: ABC transporter ATP-binding protein [Kurthia gibsonii]|uniref:ABC transporter ATP-binding protein n=1 Tax=Kurthia gibsonii TaxID=33946 RepID=A0ABU9LPJ1_9BACL|nr:MULTISPECIES: ABC transporter ATP-binding protein [Kurthia]MCA9723939.1 ABC transporter ATP-binding protein [Kurthia sp.]AMA61840.1 ABC transporter family protein [Kurthia sp. 11kri321]MEB6113576.1 ABC transporter ATP-binding protein [Kurthia gibsonii]RXH52003.1 ABC transporter ATP-binding protein [Kurthia gibsonii]WIL38381.1 ABC transporter ATP-binding protein [Kurthia sp. YJT4]